MDDTIIKRRINIDLITDAPNPTIEWFNGIWEQLSTFEIDVYHYDGSEVIYYINGEKPQWIFYQDNKWGRFWCNLSIYWLPLASKFDLNYEEIQVITKLLVENALNNKITLQEITFTRDLSVVDNALNNLI